MDRIRENLLKFVAKITGEIGTSAYLSIEVNNLLLQLGIRGSVVYTELTLFEYL